MSLRTLSMLILWLYRNGHPDAQPGFLFQPSQFAPLLHQNPMQTGVECTVKHSVKTPTESSRITRLFWKTDIKQEECKIKGFDSHKSLCFQLEKKKSNKCITAQGCDGSRKVGTSKEPHANMFVKCGEERKLTVMVVRKLQVYLTIH